MLSFIILMEVRVERQNISGFEVSVWATVKEKRNKIENNTKGFWKWLDNLNNGKIVYYMVRMSKV